MEKKIKNYLLEIELALKKEDWDRALLLYRSLNENLDEFLKKLNNSEAQEALKIVQFLDKLLQEKISTLQKQSQYLQVRQKYNQYS